LRPFWRSDSKLLYTENTVRFIGRATMLYFGLSMILVQVAQLLGYISPRCSALFISQVLINLICLYAQFVHDSKCPSIFVECRNCLDHKTLYLIEFVRLIFHILWKLVSWFHALIFDIDIIYLVFDGLMKVFVGFLSLF